MKYVLTLAAVFALSGFAPSQAQDNNKISYLVSITAKNGDPKAASFKILYGTQPTWTINFENRIMWNGVPVKTAADLIAKIKTAPHVRVEIFDGNEATFVAGSVSFKSTLTPPPLAKGAAGPQKIDPPKKK